MRDNVMDTNKPSPGRMYDYYLGGNHNFEVDRIAADKVIKVLPFLVKYARLQRWSLQDIALELTTRRDLDVIIDFASGLPTGDHIHTLVPKGTTVIYSDYDPIVVEYAHEILKDTPNVYYFENDLTRPEELLENPEVVKILGGRRKIGLCLWGISGFLYDDELTGTMHKLYEWADPGSVLAFNAQVMDIDPTNPAIVELFKIYEQFGQESHWHTSEEYTKLIEPWKLDEKGWISLLEWHGFESSDLAKEDVEAFGPMGGGFGAYLTK